MYCFRFASKEVQSDNFNPYLFLYYFSFLIFRVIKVVMPPKTKSSSDHPLLGQPSTVLRQEFLQAHQEGGSDVDIFPFKGPLQLPSKGQVLKLYLFYRVETCSKNHVPANVTANKVAKQVFKYWNMAGYQVMVMPRIENHILKLADAYKPYSKAEQGIARLKS